MIKKNSYSVPEGYFDNLESKLTAIPQMQGSKARRWEKISPYLALAACFCFSLVLGKMIIKGGPALDEDGSTYQEMVYADLIPYTEPLYIFTSTDADESEALSQEDIISYLIESGASIELIDYHTNK